MSFGKRRVRYPGALGQPIAVASKEDAEAAEQLFRAKMPLLLDHYKIPMDDPDMWEVLAINLILDHVEGFDFVPPPVPRGKKMDWTDERCAWLAYKIDQWRKLHPGESDAAACRELAKNKGRGGNRWDFRNGKKGQSPLSPKTLENKLRRGRQSSFYRSLKAVENISLKEMFAADRQPPSLVDLLKNLKASNPP